MNNDGTTGPPGTFENAPSRKTMTLIGPRDLLNMETIGLARTNANKSVLLQPY
jgi:hypothetical protein